MGKLDSISANPMIRNYAQGAAQSAIQPVADFISPPADVATSTGQYKVYTEKNRFHIPNTIRAVGGPANILSFEASDQTYNCTPHALDFPVDNLEQLEASQLENMLMEGATAVAEVAALAHEKTVIDAALAAVGSGTDLDASAASSVDLIDQVDTQILEVIKAAKYGSLMGVKVVMGSQAFRRFKNHNKVLSRFNGGKKTTQLVAPTIDDAMGLFIGNPEARVSFMVHDTAGPGETDSISFLLENAVLIFASKDTPTRRDPSFMKTFRLMGQWMQPGSYTSPDGRVEYAKFDWSEHVVVTNSAACKRLNFNAS